jgi:hypothetical protein
MYLSIHIVPTWSIGHSWNTSFHFSFLILKSRQDSLDGGSARHKAAINTNTSMPYVGFETTIPVFEGAKEFHVLDRAATVIGHRDNTSVNYDFKFCTQWAIRSFQLFTSWPTIHSPLFFNWYVDNANIKLKFFIVIQKSKSWWTRTGTMQCLRRKRFWRRKIRFHRHSMMQEHKKNRRSSYSI